MAYVVNLKRNVEKKLESLPPQIHDSIIKHLLHLKENPRPIGTKKLHGHEGYRMRVGNFRILYVVDDKKKVVEIYSIGHRKDVYRF